MPKKLKFEVISEEKIFEPTGEILSSGREMIYTRKTIGKIGKYTFSIKSNEPSEEAIRNTNRKVNEIMRKYYSELHSKGE